MTMTSAEIVADYRQAAKPLKQIGILADLNGCKRQEIVEILREAGCELPKQYQKAEPQAAAEPPERDDPKGESVVQILEISADQLSLCEAAALEIRRVITGEEPILTPRPEPICLLDTVHWIRYLTRELMDELAEIREAIGS